MLLHILRERIEEDRPLAVAEHALLMAVRAEVTGLAGVGEQVVAAALTQIQASSLSSGNETISQAASS